MKDSTKGTLTVFALVFGVGLMCGFFGFIAGIEKGKNKSVERLLSIEKRLALHDRIDSVLATSINAFYEYVGVGGKTRPAKQDTILDHNPIDPPAGFEAWIKRSVYQNLIKPRDIDTAKEEK